MWHEKLKIYDELVAKSTRFKRKGKSVPHTSANGYMFSFLNKEAQIGIRFSKEIQEKYLLKYNTTYFKSHNSIMKGYILITDKLLEDLDELNVLLEESYDYVMGLKTK